MKLVDATRQAEKRAEAQLMEAYSSLCSQSHKASEALRNQSHVMAKTVRKKSHQAAETTRKKVNRHPLSFIAATFGIGLILGKMMRWKRQ